MPPCNAMKPTTASSAMQVIAESIRAQLGTEAVVLITPGARKYAVVVAQAPDTNVRHADTAAKPPSESPPDANQPGGEKLAYSVDEAARALGVSRDVIYGQLRTGRLKSIKVGRRRIIGRQHIDEFLAGPERRP